MNCSAVALYSETVEVQEGFWRATRDTLVTHECRIGGVCKGGVLRPGNSTGGASAVPCESNVPSAGPTSSAVGYSSRNLRALARVRACLRVGAVSVHMRARCALRDAHLACLSALPG